MDGYQQRIASFLATGKVALNPIRWRLRNHPDYTEALVRLKTDGPRRPRGYVILASHVYLEPRKYKFALFYGGQRILALDVDPHRFHRNILRKQSFNCTHWHAFGAEEQLDPRMLNHREWLDEFWKRARISYLLPYEAPAHDKVQLRLW
jgi:hypothetical protein